MMVIIKRMKKDQLSFRMFMSCRAIFAVMRFVEGVCMRYYKPILQNMEMLVGNGISIQHEIKWQECHNKKFAICSCHVLHFGGKNKILFLFFLHYKGVLEMVLLQSLKMRINPGYNP